MEKTAYDIWQVSYIISAIYSLYDEEGIEELTPNWNKTLHDAVDSLIALDVYNSQVDELLKEGRYLIKRMKAIDSVPDRLLEIDRKCVMGL